MGMIHSIGIAGLKVTAPPDQIRTVLGSCVGIAIYDRAARVGGLAHVILPSSASGVGDRGKFADTAVDWLLEELQKVGAGRTRLCAKIAGGAKMFGSATSTLIGDRNIEAVKERLKHYRIPLEGEDVGGEKGRKMTFDPATAVVTVQAIGAEARTL